MFSYFEFALETFDMVVNEAILEPFKWDIWVDVYSVR